MNIDSEPRTISTALAGLLAVVVGLLLAACATPVPVATASAPSAVPTQQAAQAALKSLNFDPQADAYHLSLPAPLIFPFDSTELSPEAHANLRRVGRELNEIGIDRALVWGYTDNVGSTQYNLALSLRRAEIVAQAIIEGGYPATQVAVKGLGASLPIAGNGTTQGRSQNRRVVIIVQLP